MQIKKTVPFFFGLPVLVTGVVVIIGTVTKPVKEVPKENPCPVKCCQEKQHITPIESETSYPESRSIFLPENFFTGVSLCIY